MKKDDKPYQNICYDYQSISTRLVIINQSLVSTMYKTSIKQSNKFIFVKLLKLHPQGE